MNYISVKQAAEKWDISERSVRGYCQEGKIEGAFLVGKTWSIPENATKPERKKREVNCRRTLMNVLKDERENHISGGIYHKLQIEFTYNSNHIEGSRLTHDQTRYIYETNTIGAEDGRVQVDDIVETVNHFRCIDYIIDNANKQLTESMIKKLHYMLKNGTTDSRKTWFAVGEYKKLPNEVGGMETCAPENVEKELRSLLINYRKKDKINIDDLLEFHHSFEMIHPFQDGNGRVGRLILLKECLKNGIVPFIIEDNLKLYYYRGLKEWRNERGFLRDTCLTAQDRFLVYMDYFRITEVV